MDVMREAGDVEAATESLALVHHRLPDFKCIGGLIAPRRVLPALAKPASRRPVTIGSLPEYSRSLLRIQLPVVVTLAEKRQPLSRIMELGPGSIIQFDKPCEEMLDLNVGGQAVATGEAVKVGDKFGLRINSILLPEERFASLRSSERPSDAVRTGTRARVLEGRR